MNEKKTPRAVALLPIAVFLVLYLGLGIVLEYVLKVKMGFYQIPIVVAFMVSILVACLQNRSISFDEKLTLMGQGIGDKNIVTMILIFLVAGVFVGVTGRSSAEAVAYFLLSITPAKLAGGGAVCGGVLRVHGYGHQRGHHHTADAYRRGGSPRTPGSACRCAWPPSWAAVCSATTCPLSPTPLLPPAPLRGAK